MKADLVLSRRLGGEGEAALRAILTGQEVLEKAASSEHREAKLAAYLRGTQGHPRLRPSRAMTKGRV